MQPQGEIDNTCPDQKPSTSTPEQSPVHQTLSDKVIDLNQSESNKTIVQRDTFFNVMQHTFEGVNLERNTQSGLMEIPTEPFLLASGDFLPILDKVGFFLTDKFVSPFSRNWDKIFKNGLLYCVRLEFAYLGKL